MIYWLVWFNQYTVNMGRWHMCEQQPEPFGFTVGRGIIFLILMGILKKIHHRPQFDSQVSLACTAIHDKYIYCKFALRKVFVVHISVKFWVCLKSRDVDKNCHANVHVNQQKFSNLTSDWLAGKLPANQKSC